MAVKWSSLGLKFRGFFLFDKQSPLPAPSMHLKETESIIHNIFVFSECFISSFQFGALCLEFTWITAKRYKHLWFLLDIPADRWIFQHISYVFLRVM